MRTFRRPLGARASRLWFPSYYIATHGVASIETIQKYVESQFTELHPFVKTGGLRSER